MARDMFLAQLAELRLAPRDLERQLARFPRSARRRLRILALASPRLGDLAFSWPVAAFILAAGGAPLDRRAFAVRLVKAGAPLDVVGAALALPSWTRALPPEATGEIAAPIFGPSGGARAIKPLIPQDCAAAEAWFASVNRAARLGDESFALWVARQKSVTAIRFVATSAILRAATVDGLTLLGAYAFASRARETAIGGCVALRWSPKRSFSTAVAALRPWIRRVAAELCTVEPPSGPAWRKTQHVGGYSFAPRRTPQELTREGQLMRNCVGTYAEDVASGACLIFAVRKGAKTVATLEIRPGERAGEAVIAQLEAPGNAEAPAEIRRAAALWLSRQGPCALVRRDGLAPRPLDPERWESAWAPFLAAQRDSEDARSLFGAEPSFALERRIFRALHALEELAESYSDGWRPSRGHPAFRPIDGF